MPFCSDRCRLVDLGRWLDERYPVASAVTFDEVDDDEAHGASPDARRIRPSPDS
jgi:endogenous inhibitor of DNA gyrase (YacG/DUF329 family)